MCGICGIYHYREGDADAALIERQHQVQKHRGPDDWDVLPEAIPAHCAAVIIDLAYRYAKAWERFREELKKRTEDLA